MRSNFLISRQSTTPPSRKLAFSFALLCLLGSAVSTELTRIHAFAHTDPSYHSVCAINEGLNCETVSLSPYSVFAGLPVSVWGLAGYLVMGCLDSHATRARVAQDVQEAMARKLNGTPTFLIGEQLFFFGRIPEAELQRWLTSPGRK